MRQILKTRTNHNHFIIGFSKIRRVNLKHIALTLQVTIRFHQLPGIFKPFLTILLFIHTDPPRIDPLTPIRALGPGESLVLNCTAQGGPDPTITWYKNRKLIYRGQALAIKNETSAMHGLYTCKASNGIEPDDIASVKVISLGK